MARSRKAAGRLARTRIERVRERGGMIKELGGDDEPRDEWFPFTIVTVKTAGREYEWMIRKMIVTDLIGEDRGVLFDVLDPRGAAGEDQLSYQAAVLILVQTLSRLEECALKLGRDWKEEWTQG